MAYSMHLLEEKEKFTYLHAQTYSKPTNKTSPLLIHYLAGFPDKQQSPSLSFFPCFINYSFCWNPLEGKTDGKDRKQKSERKKSLAFSIYALCLGTPHRSGKNSKEFSKSISKNILSDFQLMPNRHFNKLYKFASEANK